MKNILMLLFFMILIFSCNSQKCKISQEKFTIPMNEFKIPIKINNEFAGPHSYSINFKSKLLRPYWNCYCNFMHTYDKSDHYFRNTTLEVEFQSYIYDDEIEFYKPGFSIIGCKEINHELFGFAILWLNKKQNTEEYLKYSNSILQISNKIDSTTDTLFTSLNKSIINKIFPSFKGTYFKLNLDSISWNKIDEDRYEYYNSIKFHDFKFGMGVKAN